MREGKTKVEKINETTESSNLSNNNLKNNARSKNGITLIALVITIVILIILAVVAIAAIFGEGGLIDRANYGKKESEKADAREQLELVLADAYVEKNVNEEYNQDEFLDDFIYERKPEAEVMEEEISLNGYTFELDRSVPRLGDYIGEAGNLPATIRKINVTNKTLSEVSVEVITARAEGVEYRYSYKKESEEDSSYQQVAEKEENTNTYSGLESQVVYNLKVELIKDNQVIDEEVVNVMLGEIEEGSLTFGKESWSNGTASLPVSTTTNMQIQYQINGIEEGSWTTIENNGSIPNIPNGADVYARLWDGTNGSEYISREVGDNVVPTIKRFEISQITKDNITVEVDAIDEESGLAKSATYKYYLNDELKKSSTKNTYTFEHLGRGTENNLKVEVYDNAGNKVEAVKKQEIKRPETVEELWEGEYIKYVDASQKEIECMVLYDNLSEYGVQIITMNSVTNLSLGPNDPTATGSTSLDKAKNSYNKSLETMSDMSMKLNNDLYSESARCIGSSPKKGDNISYKIDYNQMKNLGIIDINSNYWISSKYSESDSSSNFRISYYVQYIDTNGELKQATIYYKWYTGDYYSNPYTNGLRVVFKLKPKVNIVGGNGTEQSPYVLSI